MKKKEYIMKTARLWAAAACVTAMMVTPASAKDRVSRDQAREQARMRVTQDVDRRDIGESRGYVRSTVSYRDDWNGDWTRDNWNRVNTGFWPGDVAANIVGGPVGTAGAIATAPFRSDSYAYYDDGLSREEWNTRYRNSYQGRVANAYRGAVPPNNGSWASNSLTASYAERNGFVCQPGTWFTGQDGRQHICQ